MDKNIEDLHLKTLLNLFIIKGTKHMNETRPTKEFQLGCPEIEFKHLNIQEWTKYAVETYVFKENKNL